MFIRPYTISQAAMVLLATFLLIYLRAAVRRGATEKHVATRWMIQALAWGIAIILVTMLVGVAEYGPLDVLAYLRSACAILFWHAIARGLYAMPPDEPFARRGEARIVTRVVALVVGLDLCYTSWRLWHFSRSGVLQSRPLLLELPFLLAGLFVVVLLLRKLWAAEWTPGRSLRQNLRSALHTPQSRTGGFYLGFLIALFGLLVMSVIFVGFTRGATPTGLLIASDLLVSGAILLSLFAYLSSQIAPTGLELRVAGAGLTIFLGLVSLLGWIITLTFLRQAAPGVPPAQVFGAQMRAQFFVTPAAYRDLAQQLSDLLLPLLWFALIGSFFFMWANILYYRRTLKVALAQISGGFEQVQRGNLAYRIPATDWQDEFSQIVASFNETTAALEGANQELTTYQQHLQDLVDQRTAELGREMALRQHLEIRQAIQDERARIAQETHDGLLQTLMAVRIRLNRGKRLSQMEAGAIQAELAELAGEITQSVQDLRNLIHELNEQILPEGLVTALTQMIQRQGRAHAIVVHTDLAYPPGLLPLNRELDILRIVQEALTNAIRHGGATEAWVAVGRDTQGGVPITLRVQVRNNGHGFDVDQPSSGGWGLRNMQRRAEQLGGVLRIESQPGAATVVDLTVPLRATAAPAPLQPSDKPALRPGI